MGWKIGVLGFDSRRRLGIFLFTTVSRTALGPTQSPIQWVLGALSLGVKRSRREADLSPPSSVEVKECVELYFHSLITPSWRCALLKKHRDKFTFYMCMFFVFSATRLRYPEHNSQLRCRVPSHCFCVHLSVS
jgi:hypothetical protein